MTPEELERLRDREIKDARDDAADTVAVKLEVSE